MATPLTRATPDRVAPTTIVTPWLDVANPTTTQSVPFAQPASSTALPLGALATLELPIDRGVEIVVRMRYPSALTVTTQCQGYLLGRAKGVVNSGESPWEIMTSRDGTTLIELTTSSSDMLNDTGEDATMVNPAKHIFETRGCSEFIFVPTVALAGTGGTAANARVQLRTF